MADNIIKSSLPESIEKLRKVHILGISGTLMGAFASYLRKKGIEVTGSDEHNYPPMSEILASEGIRVNMGYHAVNLNNLGVGPDLVIVGNVIRADNPEMRAVIAQGLPIASLPEAMEKLLLQKTKNLVVTGTHGKTTTSTLLVYTLKWAGREPNYFFGGISKDLKNNFYVKNTDAGNVFVLEGDEYDTAFWDKVPKFNHYLPDHVILTSLEYDHADIYPDLEAIKKAFDGLLSRIRPGGIVVSYWDDPVIRDVVRRNTFGERQIKLITYGRSKKSEADYWIGECGFTGNEFEFEIQSNSKGTLNKVKIRLPGIHNALNALAVWIQCLELGIDPEIIKNGFQKFQGVKRRQEHKLTHREITLIDDFAHHPTAVRETLLALKMQFPKHRMIVVYEPRSATSRRKVFQKDYESALSIADILWIAQPFDQTRIAASDWFSSEVLAKGLLDLGKTARLLGDVKTGAKEIVQSARPKDVIVVLSNGDFGGMVNLLKKEILELN